MRNEIFNYNGTNITFSLGNGDVMINATQMAKPFNKVPKDYLRIQSAKELVKALSARQNCLPTEIVKVVNGGKNFGTWMHEDIALDFAQWLSIDFKLWCNDRLKELLKTGKTELTSTNPLELLKMAVSELEKKDQQINALQPKAQFADRVLNIDTNVDIGQVAKMLKLPYGRNTFFKKLREKGILFKNKNEPKQKYIAQGFFELKETLITRNNHPNFMVLKVLVTQKGLYYLSKIFEGTYPIPEKRALIN